MLPEYLIRPRRVRQPMDERLPDGRSVQELMAGLPTLPTDIPPPPLGTRSRTVTGPATPAVVPPVHVGQQLPSDASRLAQLMAQRQVLASADVSSPVRRTEWGVEESPPQQSPSRVRQALTGALQGAALGGQSGDPWAALGAAATGAAAGGISPRLMQAFTRRQELDRTTEDLATEQGVQFKNAQIYSQQAQPELRALQIDRQIELDRQRNEDRDADRALREREVSTRTQQAAEANRARQASLEERQRHNKAVESKTTATEEITVAGRKFSVSPSTAARILEARTTAANKPDKERTEAGIEADLETEAANDHLAKRKAADDQASQLRAEREQLMAGTGAIKNKGKIAEIDRQIAQAEKEVTYRQKEADDAFARARKAQAKMKAAPAAAKGGRSIEGAVDAFRKKVGREPTAEEIARMKRALGQ